MRIEAPFHKGELQVQERVGELDEGRRNSAAIADSILKGALRFVALQPMAVLGSVAEDGNVWASILWGEPGFMTAENERAVNIDLARTVRQPHDPLWENAKRDPRIGILLIELESRRRIRINGRISRKDTDTMRLDVDEAYPNCPKYIQRRQLVADWEGVSGTPQKPRRGSALLPEHHAMLAAADTFFVASANPRGGVDASHRGGAAGFVRVLNDTTLRIPDYAGNSMFNTLGNFMLNPHAGLVFLDFERGRTLQLVGRPIIQWELDDTTNETGGTKRYWDFEIEQWLESEVGVALRWELLDYSIHNPRRVN